MPEQKILILGLGNTLLCDEGFGVFALRHLEANYVFPQNVRLVDGGTLGLLLLSELLECDTVIVLDIALGGHAPGTFYRIPEEALNTSLSFRQSMHQTNFCDTLISCDLAGHRPKAVIIAMEPYNLNSCQAEPSPEAKARIPEFCEQIIAELGNMGVAAVRNRQGAGSGRVTQ